MYPDWDMLLVLFTKMEKVKICEKRGSYKKTSKIIIDLETFARRISKFTDRNERYSTSKIFSNLF